MNALGFEHVYQEGSSDRTLLLLHGTGGDEHDLVSLGRELDAAANVLSPRGKVLEHGMPRFFRRLAEGVFDVEDVKRRAQELADFVDAASDRYGFDPEKVYAVGFSNGANIAGAAMLLRPEVLRGAALWRAMVPLVPAVAPDLSGRRVLLAHGQADGMVSAGQRAELEGMFKRYGAEVTTVVAPGGHGLTEVDVEATQRWLKG